MVHYKLTYFNLRGRAELIRYIFAAAGQEYEDVRIEKENWPAEKPKAPFGALPYLEVQDGANSFVLPQSCAIARYLARKFKMAGSNEQEEAEADAYGDQLNDLITELSKGLRETDEAKKAEINKKLEEEIIPNNLKLFEAKMAKNNGFLVGKSLTWPEMYLGVILDWLGDKKAALFPHFPHIKALDERIRTTKGIAEWIQKRPVTAM